MLMYFLSFLYSAGCHFLALAKPSFAPLQNQFPAFFTYFTCGMAVALFWKPLIMVLNYAVFPAFVLLLLCLWLDNFILSALILPLVLTLVVFWCALRIQFGGRFVTKDFSFGMYLVHYPLVMLFVQQGFFDSCWELAFAGVMGLSFLCAYFLRRLSW